MAIPAIPDAKTLMESGVHFGHASGHWHPKMKPYIFATRDKLHIIDLEKTQEKLKETLTVLEERIRDGKTVVLVGTKKQVSDRVKQIGEALGVPYVNVRWPGGVMTNWGEIQKSIGRMKRIEELLASDEANKILKKERVMLESDLRRMRYKFAGLRNLSRKPDALFIIDPTHERNAIKEAKHEGIELFGIVDTNGNPELLDHVIPANDDGLKSLKLLLDLVEETIREGQKLISVKAEKSAEDAEPVAAEVEAVMPDAEEVEEQLKEEVAEDTKESKQAKELSKEA